MEKLLKKYEELCAIPYVKGAEPYSDISYHLPKLKEYAEKCDFIVEFGVRRGHSTCAFLAARPMGLESYDLVKWDDVRELEQLAYHAKISFTFHIGNSLEVDIIGADLAFFDTLHTKTQLERELKKHADKIWRYMIFHDTESFKWVGEPGYEAVSEFGTNCGQGIQYAIDEFLQNHPEWVVDYSTDINNGLTVLKRV